MSFIPIVCPPGGGSGPGDPGLDVEQNILCDVGPDGEILGTALAVYEYDAETGLPVGPPTFVDPVTGAPYVPTGILQPCPGEVGCLAPIQFCFQSSATVDTPGRMYDATFTIGNGFNIQDIIIDLVAYPVNITWGVTDTDGSQFASDLQAAVQSRFPGQTVSVTPGAVDPCAGTGTFDVHIECVAPVDTAPNLVQFRYNNGRDLIQNAAFNTTPPMAPTDGLTFVKRSDTVAPTATRDVNCTSVANRGWETNDSSNVFELWGPPGSPQNTFEGTTPTPRGTAVQEINAFGSGPVPVAGAHAGDPAFGQNPDTLWQTFMVPAPGNFNIRVVVGGRAGVENIPIKLSTGDTGATGIGDVINTSVNAVKVTNEPGPPAGPWTTFTQTVPLAAGLYTLSFTGPTQQDVPGGNNAFGGLFTDMRVFQDAPGTIASFTNNDTTCTVPVSSTSVVCQLWQPRCEEGTIAGWTRPSDGLALTNAAFWAQVPAPICCPTSADTPASSGGNLVQTYPVCGVVGGVPTNLEHVVITDQSGGAISDTFVGPDGGPVTPDPGWTVGYCGGNAAGTFSRILCDDNGQFVRVFVYDGLGNVSSFRDQFLESGAPYAPVGNVITCPDVDVELLVLCDDNGPFIKRVPFFTNGGNHGTDTNFLMDNTTFYVPVGTVRVCESTFNQEVLCDDNGPFIRYYHYVNGLAVGPPEDQTLDGLGYIAVGTVGPCPVEVSVSPTEFEFEEEILCDDNGPFFRRTIFNTATQTYGAVTDFTLAGAPYVVVGTVVNCSQSFDVQYECFIDNAAVRFHRAFVFTDTTGIPTVLGDFLNDGTPYVFVPGPGLPRPCNDALLFDTEQEILCDSNGTQFLRVYSWLNTYSGTNPPTFVTNLTLAGAPFVPVGAVGQCPVTATLDQIDSEQQFMCDSNGPTTFLRRYEWDAETGAFIVAGDFTIAGAPYVPVGTVTAGTCDTADCCPINVGEGCTNTGSGTYVSIRNDDGTISLVDAVTGAAIVQANIIPCPETFVSEFILCDNVGSFIRKFIQNAAGLVTATVDLTFAGLPYVPTGPVVRCLQADFDLTEEVLCDDNGGFIRRFTFNSTTGALTSTTNLTLAGAAYVPVGTVRVCADPAFNIEEEILCDNNGGFLRRFVFNGVTGALISTTNLTLAGAAYVPVGTVGTCEACCPINIGQGCTNVGSGTYVAIRLPNGTITITDPITGAVVPPANIVPCTTTVTPVTSTEDSTIARQTGAGAIVIAAGARSITLQVYTGNPTVAITGSTTTAVPAGSTLTWAVDSSSQSLLKAHTFTGIAGDDFIIITTR